MKYLWIFLFCFSQLSWSKADNSHESSGLPPVNYKAKFWEYSKNKKLSLIKGFNRLTVSYPEHLAGLFWSDGEFDIVDSEMNSMSDLCSSTRRQFEREHDIISSPYIDLFSFHTYGPYVRAFYIEISTEYKTIKIWCGQGNISFDIFEPVETNCHNFGVFDGNILACTRGASVTAWDLETLEKIIDDGREWEYLEYNKDTEAYRLIM